VLLWLRCFYCCRWCSQSLPEDTRAKLADDPSILLYFSFARAVLQAALAQHTKETTFQSDLAKLQVKPDYANELANAYKQRSVSHTAAPCNATHGSRWPLWVQVSVLPLAYLSTCCFSLFA
jgi:hypothetical protein